MNLSKLLINNPDIVAMNPDLDLSGANGDTAATDDTTAALLQDIALAGLPLPKLEYRFDPSRKWAADFAWPEYKLLLEVEGGLWLATSTGRSKGHAHPKRYLADIEKYNKAALLGWRLLRYTPAMVKDGTAVTDLMAFFEQEKP